MIEFSCRLSRPRFTLEADFNCPSGCVALFGPSGSGKTTVAKLIAGLERPQSGRIVVGDRVLLDTNAGIDLPVHKRRVGLVFQDGQLLPHLSVRQNLAYGRYFSPVDAREVPFDGVVELLGIGHLLAARPATLSGGERQRVAIGRALLAAPRLLVMDEPLASLDADRKLEILPFIERLRDELSLPIVYVSHALEEVARLATVVVRMSEGRIVAQGPPTEVFAAALPESAADRFEAVSVLAGTSLKELTAYAMTTLAHPAGEIAVPGLFGPPGRTVRMAIRATNVTLATEKPQGLSVRTTLKGRIHAIAVGTGPTALVTVELDGGDKISASLTRLAISDLGLDVGREVYALVKAVSIDERSVVMLG
ncbi:molybdenum ABC transporter ATP-binding protein [Hyphomicrobium sp. LHD-15]|uniref:molybdenum ABC transporter ATP-binding protein n=1 Tax=Hyphomicrobium sp. LHD-15 TaxID=3072142 RepID=UPI00280F45AA|nr:molybdenum ABC transporter ATP-binding protein [Hyphomicrobium sp. LHD-15]MDQ8699860.1 molybdenum ABC transporter ATP-binding protein [Hyphomicrobium sp. LHD-15]